jgi:bifunctional DNA-binding transcriptional regulator/antitoxin component of YhaV-PrlF toxin-antitoxin module
VRFAEIVARVGAICLALPETQEEDAWVGVRWRIRSKTFAHVVPIEGGKPGAYAAAAGTEGPAIVLTFRSDGDELEVLGASGPPFFKPVWFRDIVGLTVTDDVDWAEVTELITESYCLLAPKKLAALVRAMSSRSAERRRFVKFRTTIARQGNNTGVVVPDEVVTALGAGKKPPVVVTLNGYTYRSSIASMGGRFMISLSRENRERAGLEGGEELDVEVVVDDQPRVVEPPSDFAAALQASPAAAAAFAKLSYSHQRQHVLAIEEAKAAETRQRRIAKAVAQLER